MADPFRNISRQWHLSLGARAMVIEVHPHIVGADAIKVMALALAAQCLVPGGTRHKTTLHTREAQ